MTRIPRTGDSYSSKLRFALLFGIGSALLIVVALSGSRAAVSRVATGKAAAFPIAHAARAAFEGIFLIGDGGTLACGGAYRIHRGVLHRRRTFRSLGAAGIELRKLGEHDVSVDFGSGDRSVMQRRARNFFSGCLRFPF